MTYTNTLTKIGALTLVLASILLFTLPITQRDVQAQATLTSAQKSQINFRVTGTGDNYIDVAWNGIQGLPGRDDIGRNDEIVALYQIGVSQQIAGQRFSVDFNNLWYPEPCRDCVTSDISTTQSGTFRVTGLNAGNYLSYTPVFKPLGCYVAYSSNNIRNKDRTPEANGATH